MQRVVSTHTFGGKGRRNGLDRRTTVQILECGDAVEGNTQSTNRRVCPVCTKNQVRESQKKVTLTQAELTELLEQARNGTTGN